ncbi:MAG: ATP-binding cassette domain-containing protein, partial [Betaproteobacteria bacterium]|nr:ATP-binding cassette domain-containing protein [Candidatus Fonsibacter lacus]
MIVCRDVDFAYPGGAPVLSGFSLELPPGKVCAIMGASGGGKTTVLRLLSGQQRATRGEVRVFDQDVAQLDEKGLRT